MGNSLSQSAFDPMHFEGVNHLNTRYFSLNGHKCYGKVVRVTDGDSIWVAIDFPEIDNGELQPTIFKCCMAEYDAPEMNDTDPDRRAVAQRYHTLLNDQINGKNVWLEFGEPTKFERQLVTVFMLDEDGEPNNTSVNSVFAEENIGVEESN